MCPCISLRPRASIRRLVPRVAKTGPISRWPQHVVGARWCSSSSPAGEVLPTAPASVRVVGVGGQTKSYTFAVRTRGGLVDALRAELDSILRVQNGGEVAGGLPGDASREDGVVVLRGAWSLLYTILFQSRLAGSVSVRVGEPFQCRSVADLVQGVRGAPWREFLRMSDLSQLPIHVKAHAESCPLPETKEEIEKALDAALQEVAGCSAVARRAWSFYGDGLRIFLERGTCILELNCSGRLGVRPFVFAPTVAEHNGTFRGPSAPAESRRFSPIQTPYHGGLLADERRPQRALPPWSVRESAGMETPAQGESNTEVVEDIVAREWHGTKDLAASYAAAIVQQIPWRDVLSASDQRGGMVIWDPFCGNGALLLEIIAALLKTPQANPDHPFPCKALLPHSPEGFAKAGSAGDLLKHDDDVVAGLRRLTILGSDLSGASILRARRLLHRYCVYHKDHIPAARVMDVEGSRRSMEPSHEFTPRLLRGPTILQSTSATIADDWKSDAVRQHDSSRTAMTPMKRRRSRHRQSATADEKSDSDAQSNTREPSRVSQADAEATKRSLRSFSSIEDPEWGVSLPCEVSLNVASYEQVGPYISGPMIVTRVPREVRALGPTGRVAELYKRFSHFVGSRKDWSGVYVFEEGPDFRRHSRLPWDTLLQFTDHAGRKCRLLRLRQGAHIRVGGFYKQT